MVLIKPSVQIWLISVFPPVALQYLLERSQVPHGRCPYRHGASSTPAAADQSEEVSDSPRPGLAVKTPTPFEIIVIAFCCDCSGGWWRVVVR
jgi:hypothetical protein